MNDLTPDPSAAPVLRGERLSKRYPDGEVEALRGVSIRINDGESVAVMGPSGCGKTTLLHLLGGLDQPTEGEVFFRGAPLTELDGDEYRAREIGFVFQSFHLLATLSAVENVQVPMFETSWPARERARRAEALVEQVGMSHRRDHRANKLSVGERQRIAIARALANEPRILLADEPTGNLDSHDQDEILKLLADLHRSRGLTLVIVTHSPDVAAAAERVVRMRDGLIVES
jgi:putative ABC transport system ATP-binding protein